MESLSKLTSSGPQVRHLATWLHFRRAAPKVARAALRTEIRTGEVARELRRALDPLVQQRVREIIQEQRRSSGARRGTLG